MNKRVVLGAVVSVLIVSGVASGVVLYKEHQNSNASAAANTPNAPAYATILPSGKTIGQLGGWTLVSPSYAAPVYAYADKISGIGVTVSEQQLPDSFKADPSGQLQKMATAYNATDQLQTGSTRVYIGTSVNGPQSVIFIKNNLLILIKSEKAIDNKSWLHYVAALS